MKRARDHEDIEDYLEESTGRLRDFDAESGEQEGDVAMVTTSGPPWYDSRTGKELDPEKEKIGMEKERGCMDLFGVHTDVPDTEPVEKGIKPIKSGWVLNGRVETVKARLVACEVNFGEWRDAFAATPTSVSMRLLLQRALVHNWRVFTAD
eukprot:14883761-Heterocapsa_arctica.AAC.1